MRNLNMFFLITALFTCIFVSTEAQAQQQWEPVAVAPQDWGPDREKPAYFKQIGDGAVVVVCPPKFPYARQHKVSNGRISLGCSNGRGTSIYRRAPGEPIYVVDPPDEQITADNGERIEVRRSGTGWLTAVVYNHQPYGDLMNFPALITNGEEVYQFIISDGRMTTAYWDPETGTVVAVQQRAPLASRLGRRRIFIQTTGQRSN